MLLNISILLLTVSLFLCATVVSHLSLPVSIATGTSVNNAAADTDDFRTLSRRQMPFCSVSTFSQRVCVGATVHRCCRQL